jgi:hypothetical protein
MSNKHNCCCGDGRICPSHGAGVSELLDAAEWCECLAAKLTLVAADSEKPQCQRIKANVERIALWEAATIMRREVACAQAYPPSASEVG